MAPRGPRMVNLALALATTVACLFVLFTPGAGAVTLPAGLRADDCHLWADHARRMSRSPPTGVCSWPRRPASSRRSTNLNDTTADGRSPTCARRCTTTGPAGCCRSWRTRSFPAQPYVYVFYTLDAPIGGTPPVYGGDQRSFDTAPRRRGGLDENCIVGSRISRLTISGETMSSEQVLVEDYCQQYPAHAAGGLAFGADGNLYASGSDGSTSAFWDYGQTGTPANPCGDPPGGVGANLTPPTSEGGRLRAQDLRTTGDPTGLDGSLIRINPLDRRGRVGQPARGQRRRERQAHPGLRLPRRDQPRDPARHQRRVGGGPRWRLLGGDQPRGERTLGAQLRLALLRGA